MQKSMGPKRKTFLLKFVFLTFIPVQSFASNPAAESEQAASESSANDLIGPWTLTLTATDGSAKKSTYTLILRADGTWEIPTWSAGPKGKTQSEWSYDGHNFLASTVLENNIVMKVKGSINDRREIVGQCVYLLEAVVGTVTAVPQN